MRQQFSFTLLAAISAVTVVFFSVPSFAEGMQDRYCLQGRQQGYPGNCQFSTYEQCLATASGTDAYCGINPRAAHGRQHRSSSRYEW